MHQLIETSVTVCVAGFTRSAELSDVIRPGISSNIVALSVSSPIALGASADLICNCFDGFLLLLVGWEEFLRRCRYSCKHQSFFNGLGHPFFIFVPRRGVERGDI